MGEKQREGLERIQRESLERYRKFKMADRIISNVIESNREGILWVDGTDPKEVVDTEIEWMINALWGFHGNNEEDCKSEHSKKLYRVIIATCLGLDILANNIKEFRPLVDEDGEYSGEWALKDIADILNAI